MANSNNHPDNKTKSYRIFAIFLWILVALGIIVLGLRFFSGEDGWICEDGKWVMHGNPSDMMPIEGCGDEGFIGGQTDEYGCLIPAGYSYCPSREMCMRMWEDYCEEYKDAFRGAENPELIDSFDDCIHSGYPVMESYPRQCSANNQTFTEKLEE